MMAYLGHHTCGTLKILAKFWAGEILGHSDKTLDYFGLQYSFNNLLWEVTWTYNA